MATFTKWEVFERDENTTVEVRSDTKTGEMEKRERATTAAEKKDLALWRAEMKRIDEGGAGRVLDA